MAGSGGRVVHASPSCAVMNTSSTSCDMYLVLMIYDAGLNVKDAVTYCIGKYCEAQARVRQGEARDGP